MPNEANPAGLLRIKKYPNRRFYDSTRSCNVTLADLHELICQGHELVVADSASGQDITNLILTQIIMEHDPPKLDFFPPNILHQVIRTQQKLLGNVAVQFFQQMIEAQKASQQQWTRFLQSSFGNVPWMNSGAMDWTRAMMNALVAAPTSPPPSPVPQPASPPADSPPSHELAEVREQLRTLTRRMLELEHGNPES